MEKTTKQLIYITDLDGRYLYVNQAFCHLTGYTQEEVLSMNSHHITHQDMPKRLLEELSQTLSKGFSWQGVLEISSKDGQTLWLDAFITPHYQQGKIIGYQAICLEAKPKLIEQAQKVYQAINDKKSLATFEFTKNHKFILLVLLTVISQVYIFTEFGLATSVIAALSAVAPILVFWQDIIPTALRAQRMQTIYDSLSRQIYFGKGTASVFDLIFQ